MKNWLKRFFSVSNEINENVVIGTILLPVFVVSLFAVSVSGEKMYILAAFVALCFGLGALKK